QRRLDDGGLKPQPPPFRQGRNGRMPSYKSMIPAAALLIALAVPVGAQQTPPDPGAAANIRESKAYTALLRSNPACRKNSAALECGPITDPQLHASCIVLWWAYIAPKK